MNSAALPVFETLAALIPVLFIAVLLEDRQRTYSNSSDELRGFYHLAATCALFVISLAASIWGIYVPSGLAFTLSLIGLSLALTSFLTGLLTDRLNRLDVAVMGPVARRFLRPIVLAIAYLPSFITAFNLIALPG